MAKRSHLSCASCSQLIDAGELQAYVVDDRKLKVVIKPLDRRSHRNEMPQYNSIIRFWVHLRCYQPIYPHPIKKDYFCYSGSSAGHNVFDYWFARE